MRFTSFFKSYVKKQILAVVGISMLTGENGILKKATTAKEETIKSQLKEELELAIIEIQADELEKGNSVTLFKIGTELKNKFNNDIEFDNLEKDNQENLTGEYKWYEFTIDGTTNKVTIGEKVTENGIYEFKATDSTGVEKLQQITICSRQQRWKWYRKKYILHKKSTETSYTPNESKENSKPRAEDVL